MLTFRIQHFGYSGAQGEGNYIPDLEPVRYSQNIFDVVFRRLTGSCNLLPLGSVGAVLGTPAP